MLIALIDDGINKTELKMPNKLVMDLMVDENGNVSQRHSEGNFGIHGTMCARIIELYTKEVEFVSICIFDNVLLKTNSEKLVKALEWCLENDVKIINLSVGTRLLTDYGNLRRVIINLIKKGHIIIAAGNNAGTFTLPACMGGVIGVSVCEDMRNNEFGYYDFGDGLQVIASSAHESLRHNNLFPIDPSNSYATPTITAAVCNAMQKSYFDKSELHSSRLILGIFEYLFKGEYYRAIHPDFIENAVVLNLSGSVFSQKHIFFEYKEIDYSNLKEEVFEESKCFVFIPGNDKRINEQVLFFVYNNLKHIQFFLYAKGKEREQKNSIDEINFIKKIRKGTFFWQENDCGIIRWIEKNRELIHRNETVKTHEDVVYVLIQTQTEQGIDIVCDLRTKFAEEGYQCIIASNYKFSYLYNMEFIPKFVKEAEAIAYLNNVFEVDLIILLDCEWRDWKIREDDVYMVKESELKEDNLFDKIMSYFV